MAFKFGSQFLINTFTDRDQDNVSLAGLANGLFVAAFETKQLIPNPALGTPADDIGLQIFNADHSKRSEEANLTFGSVFGSFDPVVAAAPDATFYVGFETNAPSGAISLGGPHLDIDLNPVANSGLGFPGVGTADTEVAIAVRADGGRFAVFQSSSVPGPDPNDPQIRHNFFNEAVDNGVRGDEVNVSAMAAGIDTRPDVAALDSGRFVTVWEAGTGVAFRLSDVTYGPDPNFPIQLPFVATTTHIGTAVGVAAGTRPAVAALPNDRFVVLWYDGVSLNQISGRVYDGNGNASGAGLGSFVVATNVDHNAGSDRDIAVTVLTNGTFVVAWTGIAGTLGNIDSSGTYIDAAVFSSTATPGTNPFTVFSTIATQTLESLTTITAGNQFDPSLAALADGRFVLGWTDASASADDTSGLAVRAQVFDSRTAAVTVNGTTGHDDYIGSDFADTLNGLGDNDRLRGGKGNDTLDGGPGDDTAVFAGVLSQFRVDQLANGDLQVVDLRPGSPEGTDTLHDIENIVFTAATFIATLLINHAPVIGSNGGGSNAVVSIAETATAVTTIAASDPDIGNLLIYSIVGGADASRFAIDASSGALSFVAAPNFEVPTDSDGDNSYVVEVSVTDGVLADTQTLTVSVTDIADSAPQITSNGGGATATVSMAENTATVITVSAIDPDAGTSLGYSIIGGADASRLAIDASSGALSFVAAPDFEAPTDSDGNNSYVVQVRVTDGGLADTQTITVAVTDVNEQPNPGPPVPGDDDGNALFDTPFYLSRNPDVFDAGVNALSHFNTFGFHEGRDPNALFDTSGYLAVNKDVAAAGINPLDHFHQSGWKEGRDPSADFDTTLYLIHNPDVAAAGVDPLEHFLQFGQSEGRTAFAAVGQIIDGFDAQFYLLHNPDVAATGVDALTHFNSIGRFEGRDPNAWFDTAGYLSHYADVAAAGVNPLAHYEAFGFHEGRDPSAGFDTLGYLAANPDVAAANVNPLDHFLIFGVYEGRAVVNDGVFH